MLNRRASAIERSTNIALTQTKQGTRMAVTRSRKTIHLLLTLAAAGATWLAVGAAPSSAAGPTLDQVMQAGWSCRLTGDPTRTVCGQPGHGLPPRPGTPGFADRAPTYELLLFSTATGELLGFVKQLRPDIYAQGTPPCPQHPSGGGEFLYEPFLDLWVCLRLA